MASSVRRTAALVIALGAACARPPATRIPEWAIPKPGTKYDQRTGLPVQVEATGCGLDLVLVVGAGSDPFYIGKHEVTPDEWRSIVGEWPENYYLDVIAEWHPPSPQKEPPAVAVVDWFDLDEFKSRTGMRLPTVREWREAFHADGDRPVHLSDYYEYCEPGRAEPGDIDIFARRRDRGVLSGSFRVARDP